MNSQATTSTENNGPANVEEDVVVPTISVHNMAKEKQHVQPAVVQQFRHPTPFPQRFQKQK